MAVHKLPFTLKRFSTSLILALTAVLFVGCANTPIPPAPATQAVRATTASYLIGPGDTLQVFVWGNPDLSVTLPVRPDGRVSTPLVDDLEASGKTPTQLAREIERAIRPYTKDTIVTVMVTQFAGPYSQQIRVIGEAAKPQALPYRQQMTLLDVMIVVGGLTEFAAGNNATIVRKGPNGPQELRVRLDDLIKNGDISANVEMLPGDILIVPESWF